MDVAKKMEAEARVLAHHLGLFALAKSLNVRWHSRLRTTAGLACARNSRILLNPRLLNFPEELHRTFLHEMAHLVARARHPQRRMAPHGREWKQACADLGVPNESRCHTLTLAPSKKRIRKYFYRCPHCAVKIARVVPLRRQEACVACCRLYARGKYDRRFRFVAESKLDDNARP